MAFSDFEAKINKTVNKENFEEWDDYILWESYVKTLQYWRRFQAIFISHLYDRELASCIEHCDPDACVEEAARGGWNFKLCPSKLT